MFQRQTYYYHIISSAWGIKEWLENNGYVEDQQTSEGEQQQQQQQPGGNSGVGEFAAASVEAVYGQDLNADDDQQQLFESSALATIEDGNSCESFGSGNSSHGRGADHRVIPAGEGGRGHFNVAGSSYNVLRESPWRLCCEHERGCGTKRKHWHFIYISRSKQWGHNSSLGRVIRTGQHKCEGISCVACLVQYLYGGNGRKILKNILTRSNFSSCQCAFHGVEGAHSRHGQGGYPANTEGRAGAFEAQGIQQAVGQRRVDPATDEAGPSVPAEGRRGMELESQHSGLGEEPAPGTRRYGADPGGSGPANNFSNAKLVLLFCAEKCFCEGEGERILSRTPEGIEYMFKYRAGERIKTAVNIARILVFQETLKKRVERCKQYQLKQDPEIADEAIVDRDLGILVTILEANDIDVENFARNTFNHLIQNCGKRNNLFFYGPPSTGKTMIMESLVNLHFNFARLTGLTPNSSFNFASLLNTNACFMDECKLTDNQFEQWKLLAAGSPMCTDVKYKERHNIENCVLYTSANHAIGTYIQSAEAHKAIDTRTIQYNFIKNVSKYTPFSAFVWEKLWSGYKLQL